MSRLLALLVVSLCFIPATILSTTIRVPSEQPTIQAGIDAASEGDTVLVADGAYNYEYVQISQGIYLLSENGPSSTFIEGHFGILGLTDTVQISGFNFRLGRVSIDSRNCSYLEIGNCIFQYNRVEETGGCDDCGPFPQPGGLGAAIICEQNEVTKITNCVFDSNFVIKGGALIPMFQSKGGAIFSRENSELTITGSIFQNNIAEEGLGGAIYSTNSNLSIVNCTFVENTAQTGGSIFIENDQPYNTDLTNNIFYKNSADSGAVVCFYDDAQSSNLICNDLYDNGESDLAGTFVDQLNKSDNFSSDPLFCDPANGDFQINSLSPCTPENSPCGELVGALGVVCETYAGPVWHVSLSGSDENGDGSRDFPFKRIQTGINRASEGDTVLALRGRFYEHDINFHGKDLVLLSEVGAEHTWIDTKWAGRAFVFENGESNAAVVSGFHIVGGKSDTYGGGLYCENSSPTFTNNIFSGHGSGYVSVIHIDNSSAVFTHNVITDNASGTRSLIGLGGDAVIFENNTIVNNRYSGGHGLIRIYNGNVQLSNCIIAFNRTIPRYGPIIVDSWASVSLTNCVIFGNMNGDWRGDIENQQSINGNLWTDPLFCGMWARDFSVASGSVCAPENNVFGVLIGAQGVGCDISAPDYYCRLQARIQERSMQSRINIYYIDEDHLYVLDTNSNLVSRHGEKGYITSGIFALEEKWSPDELFTGRWVSQDPSPREIRIAQIEINRDSTFDSQYGLQIWVNCDPYCDRGIVEAFESCYGHMAVDVDIKPGSCQNPINANGSTSASSALVPVAVLGTEEFDAGSIDPLSITLAGVSPVRHAIEDVGMPVDRSEDSCACNENGPDGYDDLTLKFRRSELIAALSGLPRSPETKISLTGVLFDSTAIEGYDCVKLLNESRGPLLTSDTLGSPEQFKVYGAYPNPFNPSTTISYDLPERGHVRIEVFNMLGQRVTMLADEIRPAGRHSVLWNAEGLASGIYLYRIQTMRESITEKMILLK